jgi:hypothetical protein
MGDVFGGLDAARGGHRGGRHAGFIDAGHGTAQRGVRSRDHALQSRVGEHARRRRRAPRAARPDEAGERRGGRRSRTRTSSRRSARCSRRRRPIEAALGTLGNAAGLSLLDYLTMTMTTNFPSRGPRCACSSSFRRVRGGRRDCVSFPSASRASRPAAGSSCCRRPSFAPMQLPARGGRAGRVVPRVDPRSCCPVSLRAEPDRPASLGASETDGAVVALAIVSFDDVGPAFANLRAPIVINPERMLGYQVMPHNSLYPLRHPLASE